MSSISGFHPAVQSENRFAYYETKSLKVVWSGSTGFVAKTVNCALELLKKIANFFLCLANEIYLAGSQLVSESPLPQLPSDTLRFVRFYYDNGPGAAGKRLNEILALPDEELGQVKGLSSYLFPPLGLDRGAHPTFSQQRQERHRSKTGREAMERGPS